MKFLKVLLNSLLTGLFFCSLLALLIQDLNINLTFDLWSFLQLSLYLMLVYGLLVALVGILAFFVSQFFAGRSLKIALVSPSFLIIGFTAVTILVFLLLIQNFRHFASLFSPEVSVLLNRQQVTLAFLAVLGLLVIISGLGYKKRIVFYILYFVFFGFSMVYIVRLRIQYPQYSEPKTLAALSPKPIDKRLTVIGMEGLSIDLLITFLTEGKLPNFNFLIENGSWGTLQNFTPTEMVLLDTSFNTGKLPAKHRRLSSWEYSFLNLKPAYEVVPRYLFFKQLTRIRLLSEREAPQSQYVKDIWDIFQANGTPYLERGWTLRPDRTPITPKAETSFNRIYEDLRFDTSEVYSKLKQALCSDIMLESSVVAEREQSQPQLLSFLLPGLNSAERYFLQYSYSELFGEIDQEHLMRYSTVIERYYQYYDEVIGKYLAAKKEDELLVVYSPHGVDILPVWKRVSEWIFGDPEVSGYHEGAPEGVIFFLGKDIAPDRNITEMHIIDVTPTLLHYLGLPVGKDMDGVVNSAVFAKEFKSEPVLYISSYEEHNIKNDSQ
ncbi:MAG: alkaline phosphatase family protein [Candidatus Aminicenantaceae bacterium]